MPIYEYTCDECSTLFEEIVLKQDDVPACPQCKSIKTSKLISKSRSISGSGGDFDISPSPQSSRSGCAGCSGGSCSTCG